MAWKEYPLLGFAPDLPNTTPGTLIYTYRVMPTDRGIGVGPVFSTNSSTPLNSQSLGGASLFTTTGTQRVFIGTATKLYETTATPTTLTDRSDTTYAATTTKTWAFTQFGDISLAVNLANIMRFIDTSASAFAAVGIAPTPKASCITMCGPTSAPFVMVGDYDDGTNAYRDGWYSSALGDYTDWTPSVATECVNGRLIDDIPGPITAMIGFRDDVIAFKGSGMYIGTYVGAPVVWAWRRISSDIGCIGKNAVCRANDVLYFADVSGVWTFDGSYPRLVAGHVHRYWSTKATANLATAINANFFKVMWDKPKHVLHCLQGQASGPAILDGMSWNSISELWTLQPAGSWGGTAGYLVAELIAPRITVISDNVGAFDKTVGTVAWTTIFVIEPAAGKVYGWMFNDRIGPIILKGFRPHWTTVDTTAPATARFDVYASQSDLTTETQTPQSSVNLVFRSPGKYDGQASGEMASWYLAPVVATNWEITGVTIDAERAGGS